MAPATVPPKYIVFMPGTREGMKAKAEELIQLFKEEFAQRYGNGGKPPEPITILREMRLYKASCRNKDAKDQWEEVVCHLLWPALEATTTELRRREKAGYEEALKTAGGSDRIQQKAMLEQALKPSHKYKGYRQNGSAKK